jgi:hypothetical protein
MLGFLAYLLGFHSWIKYKGFSTYEYIMWNRIKVKMQMKVDQGVLKQREYDNWVRMTTPRDILVRRTQDLERQVSEILKM